MTLKPAQPLIDTDYHTLIEKMKHIEVGLDGINRAVVKLDERSMAILIRLERGDARFDHHNARLNLQEKVVFGTIGLICTGVISALLYLVIKR